MVYYLLFCLFSFATTSHPFFNNLQRRAAEFSERKAKSQEYWDAKFKEEQRKNDNRTVSGMEVLRAQKKETYKNTLILLSGMRHCAQQSKTFEQLYECLADGKVVATPHELYKNGKYLEHLSGFIDDWQKDAGMCEAEITHKNYTPYKMSDEKKAELIKSEVEHFTSTREKYTLILSGFEAYAKYKHMSLDNPYMQIPEPEIKPVMNYFGFTNIVAFDKFFEKYITPENITKSQKSLRFEK